jgi:hypothetical protein
MIKGDIFTSPIEFALQESIKRFEGDEEKAFQAAVSRAAEAVLTILGAGMTAAMNKFNAAEKSYTENNK